MMVWLFGCVTEGAFQTPDPGWERMWHQSRKQAYEPSDLFADGKVMRAPPEGAVPSTVPPVSPVYCAPPVSPPPVFRAWLRVSGTIAVAGTFGLVAALALRRRR